MPRLVMALLGILLLSLTPLPCFAQPQAQTPAAPQKAEPPPITTTTEVLKLTREQLVDHPKVDLDVVILSVLLGTPRNLQAYNNGASVYVQVAMPLGWKFDPYWNQIKEGDRVRIRGFAKAGNSSPIVAPEIMEPLGTLPIPEPRPVTVAELSSGRLESQWVSMSGVVRGINHREGDNWWGMDMSNSEGEFMAKLIEPPPDGLVGSYVHLRGACFGYYNIRGQILGLMIQPNRVNNITIVRPAPADPFDAPLVTTDVMQPFDLAQATDSGRNRLRGTVIHVVPGSHLFLQDKQRGVKVGLAHNQTAAIGDQVEVAGFVRVHQGFAEMTQSLVRILGTSPLPAPVAVTPDSVLNDGYYTSIPPPPDVNCSLVSVKGRFLKADTDQNGKKTFWIEGPGTPPMNVPVEVAPGTDVPRPGSLVEARGTCELIMPEPTADSLSTPKGMRLFSSRPGDITVIEEPSWWTPARLWMLVGGIGIAFALAMLQVRTLRHRVRVGAEALAEALTRRRAAEARIEERRRLGEEVHDIMAQSLTGVSLQLHAAEMARTASPDAVPRHLKLASGLLELARDEIRRTLHDLRSSFLENGDLTGALQSLGHIYTKSGAVETEWEVTGTPPQVHPLTAHSLLRVTQESMTNSMKHGQATRIHLRVDYQETAVTVTITDNGKGCEPSRRRGPQDGHFGLENMKGRMRRLGGDFEFSSSPGQGARVKVFLPVQPADADAHASPAQSTNGSHGPGRSHGVN